MRRNAYGSRGYTETMNRDEASLDKNFSALRIFNGSLFSFFNEVHYSNMKILFSKKNHSQRE